MCCRRFTFYLMMSWKACSQNDSFGKRISPGITIKGLFPQTVPRNDLSNAFHFNWVVSLSGSFSYSLQPSWPWSSENVLLLTHRSRQGGAPPDQQRLIFAEKLPKEFMRQQNSGGGGVFLCGPSIHVSGVFSHGNATCIYGQCVSVHHTSWNTHPLGNFMFDVDLTKNIQNKAWVRDLQNFQAGTPSCKCKNGLRLWSKIWTKQISDLGTPL